MRLQFLQVTVGSLPDKLVDVVEPGSFTDNIITVLDKRYCDPLHPTQVPAKYSRLKG